MDYEGFLGWVGHDGRVCAHIILTSLFFISVVLVGILGSVLDDTFFPA